MTEWMPPEEDETTEVGPAADLPPDSVFETFRASWLLLLAFGLFLLYQILTQVLWGAGRHNTWGLFLAPLLGVVLPLTMIVRRAQIPTISGLGLSSLNRDQVLAVILIMAGGLPLAYALGGWSTTWYPPLPEFEEAIRSLLPRDLMSFTAGFLALVVMVPLAEEILFRFLVFGALTRALPPVLAVLLCGSLFGAAHMAPWLLLPISFLGVLLSAMTFWTRSITAAWLGHALFNGFAYVELTVSGTTDTSQIDRVSQNPVVLVIATAAVTLGFLWLQRLAEETNSNNNIR